MISGFNRSFTFPLSQGLKKHTAYHVRSLSLPGESHQLVANLEEQIRTVRSWVAHGDYSLPHIESGLSHIEMLLSAMNEFLNFSETQTVLRRIAALSESLLESFLYLIDSYGSLLSGLVELKQHYFEVQSALRRHDTALLASSLKSQRKIEKELHHLASTIHSATKSSHLGIPSDTSEAEIVGFLKEAISATAAASVVLLNRVVAVSAASSSAAASFALCTARIRPLKKRLSDGERDMLIHGKFEELEECVEMVERGSERVLRSLVNSRVLLLNIGSGLL